MGRRNRNEGVVVCMLKLLKVVEILILCVLQCSSPVWHGHCVSINKLSPDGDAY